VPDTKELPLCGAEWNHHHVIKIAGEGRSSSLPEEANHFKGNVLQSYGLTYRGLFAKKLPWVIGAVVLGLLFMIVFGQSLFTSNGDEKETSTAERGDVFRLVTVSGVIKAQNTADLAFPTSGIVRNVTVKEGDVVVVRALKSFDTVEEAEAYAVPIEDAIVVKHPNKSIKITSPLQPRGSIVVAENGEKKYYSE